MSFNKDRANLMMQKLTEQDKKEEQEVEKNEKINEKEFEKDNELKKALATVTREFDVRIAEIDNNQKEMIEKLEESAFFIARVDKIRTTAYAILIVACLFVIFRCL